MPSEKPIEEVRKIDLSKTLSEVSAEAGDSVVICRDGICHSYPRAMVPIAVHDFIDLHEDK